MTRPLSLLEAQAQREVQEEFRKAELEKLKQHYRENPHKLGRPWWPLEIKIRMRWRW